MSGSHGSRRQSVAAPHLTIPVDDNKDHIQGSASSPVTLVEYGDYQCPYCGQAYPIIKRLQEEVGKGMRFVFRNFPLTQLHPQAEYAAELTESAGAQGKFWEMHDLVYENQPSLGRPAVFMELARDRLKLDTKRLESDIASHAHLERIRADFMGGVRSGVNGTPTFYINGVRHDGDYELETLRSAIRSAPAPRRPA